MLDDAMAKTVVERILAVSKPSKVVLVGFYVRGNADDGSDLDLMVIEPQVENKRPVSFTP